jgi:hypothetical protein
MNSEFRLCPACRAPNTVQDAVCSACGARLPAVAKAPVPTFETIPGRQEARQAARTGVRRGLAVGVASAAILGLLVARTFRAPSLQDGSAQTAAVPTPPPAATPQPEPVAAAPALPAVPAGWERPNPYASPASPYATTSLPGSLPSAAAPATALAPAPAVIIGAPSASARQAPAADAAPASGDSKPVSYTDADLARVRNEAETGAETEMGPGGRPATAPSPRSPAQEEGREKRARERREAVRAAQQRVDEAQSAVDDIRREARENDDDGLQEELSDALSELKSAQRDLARARRRLQEVEGQPTSVLPPPQ